jgi:hypothetical protein
MDNEVKQAEQGQYKRGPTVSIPGEYIFRRTEKAKVVTFTFFE